MNKDDECAICLDTIEEYDYAILSCKHMFHYKCLRSWLQTKKEYVKLYNDFTKNINWTEDENKILF